MLGKTFIFLMFGRCKRFLVLEPSSFTIEFLFYNYMFLIYNNVVSISKFFCEINTHDWLPEGESNAIWSSHLPCNWNIGQLPVDHESLSCRVPQFFFFV